MVVSTQKRKDALHKIEPYSFKWTSIPITEVYDNNIRLDATVYGVEIRHIIKKLRNLKYPVKKIADGFSSDIFYGGRSKRNYVENSSDSIGFLGSSEMLDVNPKPIKFLRNDSSVDKFRVKKGQILISRSGTIGNVTYVSSTLEKFLISEHAIRVSPNEYSGYLYAYLRSPIGKALILRNNFGAVVSQIEPEHIGEILVPDPPPIIKKKIHELIEESFLLRDASNKLIDESQHLLKHSLQFPEFSIIKKNTKRFNCDVSFNNFSVPASLLYSRLDALFHNPLVKEINKYLKKYSKELKLVGDSDISKKIILPGRFKRVYVKEGTGVIFFGGKQLYEIDPSNKKYLSLKHHALRIRDQLTLHENMVLVTCSGTIGKVNIVPKHWEGWTANQHIIRIIPYSNDMAGYLYAWLSSDYALPLIKRFSYGAVVNEIDDIQVSQIPVPILKEGLLQKEINNNILKANKLRTDAYKIELQALQMLEKLVME